LFNHEALHGASDLSFEPFKADTRDVVTFDCGNKSLNDFLRTKEVREYEEELLGRTTLVICQGKTVAYYTLFNTKLRIEYLRTYRSFSKLAQYKVDGIPAIAIGRLAVDKDWQNKGIGRTCVKRIMMDAFGGPWMSASRLVVVQAKERAQPFYEKLGFEYVFETRHERHLARTKGTRTMFFDLRAI
jgi:ribosomal protein S18 acetylase RimI-like enzyme